MLRLGSRDGGWLFFECSLWRSVTLVVSLFESLRVDWFLLLPAPCALACQVAVTHSVNVIPMGVCPMAHRSVRLGAGLGWESDQGYTRCVGMDTRSLSARAAAAKAAAAACSATLQALSSQMSEQAVKVAHSTAWKQVLVHLPSSQRSPRSTWGVRCSFVRATP